MIMLSNLCKEYGLTGLAQSILVAKAVHCKPLADKKLMFFPGHMFKSGTILGKSGHMACMEFLYSKIKIMFTHYLLTILNLLDCHTFFALSIISFWDVLMKI